jgi:hypothetical protein
MSISDTASTPGTGYLHDVFISYRRRDSWPIWIKRHFVPLLRQYLTEELDSDAEIYVDDLIESGSAWPLSLAHELARSRIVVPLLTRSYFRSSWCVAEINHMFWREQQFPSLKTLREPGGIIAPVIIHDGDKYIPREIGKIQRLELQKYAYVHLQQGTELARELEQAIRDWAPDVAACIRRAPEWDPTWGENAAKAFLDLFYEADPVHQALPSWGRR